MLTQTIPGLFDGAASQSAFQQRMLVVRRFSSAIPADVRGAFLVAVPRKEGESPVMKSLTENFIVGRGDKAIWRMADDKLKLSSLHFVISRNGNDYTLTDLNSKNGTRLNEDCRAVKSCSLKHGDFIHAAGFTFMLAIIQNS